VNDPQTDKAWQVLLAGWSEQYAKAKKAEQSDRANN